MLDEIAGLMAAQQPVPQSVIQRVTDLQVEALMVSTNADGLTLEERVGAEEATKITGYMRGASEAITRDLIDPVGHPLCDRALRKFFS